MISDVCIISSQIGLEYIFDLASLMYPDPYICYMCGRDHSESFTGFIRKVNMLIALSITICCYCFNHYYLEKKHNAIRQLVSLFYMLI